MGYRAILRWAIVLVAVLCFSFSGLAQSDPCPSVTEPATSLEGLGIRPGKYSLSLADTAGVKKGTVAEGELLLKPTSREDVSLRTGKRATKNENLSETPLYGSVSMDFSTVAAPVFDLSRSGDPIYPDVLVRVRDWKGVKRQPVLVIGSSANRRDGVMGLDGAGISLFVQQISENRFAGEWDAFGIVHGGSGHFCARLDPEAAE